MALLKKEYSLAQFLNKCNIIPVLMFDILIEHERKLTGCFQMFSDAMDNQVYAITVVSIKCETTLSLKEIM